MHKKLISIILAMAMLFGACCTTTSAAENDISKLEEAVKVINDSISSMKDVFTDQKEATDIAAIFNDFMAVARTAGTILSAVNGSVAFLKLIGLVKDQNAEALSDIGTQLKAINEKLDRTEKQLSNLTAEMSRLQASVEFNSRSERAIMYEGIWHDFEYRYMENGMDQLMTMYNSKLLNGMQDWCLNRTDDARTGDGIDNSSIVLRYVMKSGRYELVYSAENSVPSDFSPTDRYLVLTSDFFPSKMNWNVNTFRQTISEYIEAKIKEYVSSEDYESFECGHYPAFTKEGIDRLTDDVIRRTADDAVNVLLYRVAAAEINKDAEYSLNVEQQFDNYLKHLTAKDDGMDAIFNVFYLTHAFEYQIADDLLLFCDEMAVKTGVYGSFVANVLGMSAFITEKQKYDMIDAYCDALIRIGQAKNTCIKGNGRYCYLTKTELYVGEVRFANSMSVNTKEKTSTKAYESFTASPAEISYYGDWARNANYSLIGDADALLLAYMLKSNGLSADVYTLQKMTGSTTENKGTLVTSINGESPLPADSRLPMHITNVIGSYFKNGGETTLNNPPDKAEKDCFKYRRMISGTVLNSNGQLEGGKVLDAIAFYAEDHWYWEKDEAAILAGGEYPASYLKTVNKVQTKLEFPGTYYYRTEYTHQITLNCIVSVPLKKGFMTSMYSPLDSYEKLCDELKNSSDGGSSEFADVDKESYYYESVKWANELGITEGTDKTHFSPDAVCTRAQMVTLLWRMAGQPEAEAVSCDFADVDLDSYYGKALLWALESGITKGTSPTTFSPGAVITRAQMVSLLYRFDGETETSAPFAFEDITGGAYYYDAVVWAYANGITKGITETAFGPDEVCTRAQIVTFMYRYSV